MYNPYLPRSWQERPEPEPQGPPPPPPPSRPGPPGDPLRGLLDRFPVLERLHLSDLDTGDILLLLVILYLFWEDREDNLELIITLGLMLFL